MGRFDEQLGIGELPSVFVHYIRTWTACFGLFMALMHPLSGAGLGLPSELFAWGVMLRADTTLADTTKKMLGPSGIGDPTNTDLPYFYPSTLLNRKGLSRPQQPDKYLPKPKGYNQLGSIDSTLATMMLYEVMEGVDVGTITPMSLDDIFDSVAIRFKNNFAIHHCQNMS